MKLGTAERRREILRLLCRRRYDTIGNLADEFGVSKRTIQRDIEVLSISEPIYTQQGKHSGGIYVVDGYSMDRMYMNEGEICVLQKLHKAAEGQASLLTFGEKKILTSIISQYSKPISRKEK